MKRQLHSGIKIQQAFKQACFILILGKKQQFGILVAVSVKLILFQKPQQILPKKTKLKLPIAELD